MSKKVEIYDQYRNVYADTLNNNELVCLSLNYKETVDTSRYTLVHQSSGFSTIEAEDLTETEAVIAVANLYNTAKVTGVSCTDKLVKLDEAYAEVLITFSDGRRLCRVIYIKDE